MGVSGKDIAMVAGGGILMWSGIHGSSISATLRAALSGNPASAPVTETIDFASSAGTSGATATGTEIGGVSGDYSSADIKRLWTANGGQQSTAAMAAAVAAAESDGNPKATSKNPDGGTNVGLFQLDTRGVGSGYTVAQLQDPGLNTRITVMATHNGTNWSEWGNPVTAQLPGHQYTPGSAVP